MVRQPLTDGMANAVPCCRSRSSRHCPPILRATARPLRLPPRPMAALLYCSNRGHDSVAIYDTEATTGLLRSIGWQSTLGAGPRFVALDPSDRFLHAATRPATRSSHSQWKSDRASSHRPARSSKTAAPQRSSSQDNHEQSTNGTSSLSACCCQVVSRSAPGTLARLSTNQGQPHVGARVSRKIFACGGKNALGCYGFEIEVMD